jgi:hypothetical protein
MGPTLTTVSKAIVDMNLHEVMSDTIDLNEWDLHTVLHRVRQLLWFVIMI